MNNEPYDDEILSAILDGAADEATVASIQQSSEAQARLEQLRSVSRLVGTPPSEATPERRAESIAAALAAAKPAPEVSSLAVARHERATPVTRAPRRQWLAVAAAALVVAIAIPLLASIGGSDSDSVDTAADTSFESPGLSAGADDGSSTDRANASDEAATDSASSDATDDDATADLAAPATTAAAVEAPATAEGDDGAVDPEEAAAGDAEIEFALKSFGSPIELEGLIAAGLLQSEFTVDDPILVDAVAPECLAPFANIETAVFGLARLTPVDAPEQVVFLHFLDDGTTDVLDSRDCSPIG